MLIIPIVHLVCVAGVKAQAAAETREANKLYKERKFDQALQQYQQAQRLNPGDAVLQFNTGNAFFRNEKYDQAIQQFEQPIAGNDASLQQQAYYNKGVSLSRQNKLEESIVAYKRAVILNPADEDARINLQKALLELRKKQPAEQQKKESEQKKQQNKKKNEQKEPPKSKLTQKQVEQLLKALQQREQQVQQKMQQNRSRSGNRPEKDW